MIASSLHHGYYIITCLTDFYCLLVKLAITDMIERELLPLVLPHTLLSFEGGFNYTYNNKKTWRNFICLYLEGTLYPWISLVKIIVARIYLLLNRGEGILCLLIVVRPISLLRSRCKNPPPRGLVMFTFTITSTLYFMMSKAHE